jgi:hypothetical protein
VTSSYRVKGHGLRSRRLLRDVAEVGKSRQKVNVFLVDDINGSGAEETIGFSLDGTHYEIDLNSGKNAGQEAPLVNLSGSMPAAT